MRQYLLVDDNRALAENLAEILRDLGDQVMVASSGAEALELIAQHRFDAMLTDMRMPLMDGAELIHRLRRLDPGLPAVLFTAYANDSALRLARSNGLLAILAKPVPIPRLLELLGSAQRDAFVALVEDDEALSDNLCEALRARGWTAVAAASLVETSRIGDIKPFAALVDLKVPGGEMGEAMQLLEKRFPGLPMVVMTAHLDRPPPLPAHALFRKPFHTDKLLGELEQLRTGGPRGVSR